MGGATSDSLLRLVTPIVAVALACRAAFGQSSAPADPSSPSLESLLQTKVVTASRFAESPADAPGIMRVVSRDEIERFGGLTLREILGRVAGLDWTTALFTDRSIVSVRGDQAMATSGHVLFLINGRPTREVLEGGVMSDLLEAFPVGILERIEVIEGPGSVLYGSNAVSGVINLITRKVDGTSGAIRGFGSGAGPIGASAEGSYSRGDLHLSAAAQFHEDRPWITPVWPGLPSTAGPESFSLYDKSRSIYAEAGYKGFSAMFSTMEWRAPFQVMGSIGENIWTRTFADLGYDLKPGAHWDMGFHITYTGTGLAASAFPMISRKASDVEGDWTNSLAINERTRVTFGALYSYQSGKELLDIGPVTITSTDAHRPGGGFYAQLEYRLADGLNLIGGFQSNKIDNIPLHTAPRAGLMWNPYSRWHVKALYGQAFRAPSLNETYIQNQNISGNLHLLPELSSTVDLAVIYQARRLESSINYFRSHQSNSIVQIFEDNGALQYANVGGLLIHGIQWESKWYVQPRILVEGSALYQTQRDSGGRALDNLPTPAFGAKAGLSYADKQGWTIGLFDIYSGHIPGYASTQNPPPGAHQLLAANLRLNLEKYFGPAAKRVTLFAHGDNLMNRAIWAPAWGSGSSSTIPLERGRTIYYGVDFSFKRD
jgi:outer membrane receptor for ferrienterochelin and colicins